MLDRVDGVVNLLNGDDIRYAKGSQEAIDCRREPVFREPYLGRQEVALFAVVIDRYNVHYIYSRLDMCLFLFWYLCLNRVSRILTLGISASFHG